MQDQNEPQLSLHEQNKFLVTFPNKSGVSMVLSTTLVTMPLRNSRKPLPSQYLAAKS